MGKITFGERLINWAKAAAIIAPLFGAGVFAGNTDTFHGWIKGTTIAEADGRTEITEGGMTFEQSVIKNSQEVRAELDAIKTQLNKISRHTSSHNNKLQNLITKWHGDG